MNAQPERTHGLDVDGTLLDKDQTRPAAGVAGALALLQSRGDLIIPNTTRGSRRLGEAMDGLYAGPSIVENGGVIYTPDHQIQAAARLTLDERLSVALTIVRHARDIQHVAFYPLGDPGNRVVLFVPNATEAANYQQKLGDLILGEPYTDAEAFAHALDVSETCMVEIKTRAKDATRDDMFDPGLNVSHDGIFYVNRAGANKGTALQWLLDQKGISSATLIVAGDSPTDQPAFDIPGATSVAVANDSLRATHHVGSPSELAQLLIARR